MTHVEVQSISNDVTVENIISVEVQQTHIDVVALENIISVTISPQEFSITTTHTTVEVHKDDIIVVTAGTQGPPGPPGVSPEAFTAIAGETISAYRIVYVDPTNQKLYKASHLDLDNRITIIGITTSAALQDDEITVQTFNKVENTGWSWDSLLGKALYLQTNGTVSQVPPTSGFVLRIGFILSPTKAFIEFGEEIVLTT